jgi:hypothetical protein
MKSFWKVSLPACLLLAAGSAQAVKVEPGKWFMDMEGSSAMTGTLMSRKRIECIKSEDYDPSGSVMTPESQCRVTDRKEEGNRMTWSLSCPGGNPDQPEIHGEGLFISDGKTARGTMTLDLSFGGKQIRQESRWRGKWIAASCE